MESDMHRAEKVNLEHWIDFLSSGEELDFEGIEERFEERLREIAVEIRRLLDLAKQYGGADGTNNSTVSSYRKRLIYQLGLFICDHSLEKRLRKFVKDELADQGLRLRRKKKTKHAKSTFYTCLRLVFPTEEILKSGLKSDIASELQRAYEADIGPDLLVGYIYQTNKSIPAEKAHARRLQASKENRGVLLSEGAKTLRSWKDP